MHNVLINVNVDESLNCRVEGEFIYEEQGELQSHSSMSTETWMSGFLSIINDPINTCDDIGLNSSCNKIKHCFHKA